MRRVFHRQPKQGLLNRLWKAEMFDMRKSWLVPMTLVVLGVVSAVAVQAGTRDDMLKPLSVQMSQAGQAALAKGDASAALDSFEAALASDPKNVAAFTGMAQAYEKLGLPGKAVRFYREALALNPSDLNALEGQGKALLMRGANARAQINLARIKALCGKTDCPQGARLQIAIADAAKAPPQQASAEPAKPAVVKN